MYAWKILLEVYQQTKSINSVTHTIIEILDTMERSGLRVYEKLPAWMERPLYSIISLHGIKTVAKFVKTKKMDEFEPLVDTIRLAHSLQLDGCAIQRL